MKTTLDLKHSYLIKAPVSLLLLALSSITHAEIILDDTGTTLSIGSDYTVNSSTALTGYAIGIRSLQDSATLTNSANLTLTGAALNDVISGIYATGSSATIRNRVRASSTLAIWGQIQTPHSSMPGFIQRARMRISSIAAKSL